MPAPQKEKALHALLNPSPEEIELLSHIGWEPYPVIFEYPNSQPNKVLIMCRPEILKEIVEYEQSF